ncbi:MAG: hypothetical protein H6732_08965 [Alphaproteobacteria bacterium]|nr:hypothetical protein [Alphaproteobacteria bacterium]
MLAALLLGTALATPDDPAGGVQVSGAPVVDRVTSSEIGRERRFGVGLALGFPPSGTLKLFIDPNNALALHVGPTLATSGLHLRLQFEQAAKELRRWEIGELLLTWHLGVAVELIFGQQAVTSGVRFGVHGGVGVELRLVPAPIAVFGELAPVIYPFDLAAAVQGTSPFVPVQGIVAVGARWYF